METPLDNTQSPSLLRLTPLALSTVPDNITHAQQEQIADKPYKKAEGFRTPNVTYGIPRDEVLRGASPLFFIFST